MKETLKKEDSKIDISIVEETINKQVYNELCRSKPMKPLVDTLYEFNIKGIRAVSFIFKHLEKTNNQNAEEEE